MKMQKSVIFVEENFKINMWKKKNYCKVRYHWHYTGEYRGATHSICTVKYRVPKKVPIIFYNGINHDDHFIIKELVDQFKKQFTYLAENNEKNITFDIPIKKGSYKNQ